MAYDGKKVREDIQGVEQFLESQFRSLSTGRASVAVLDFVSIEQYGSRMPLAHVASVTIEDPRTLRVNPWDTSIIRDIEKAINEADLGLSVSSDEKGLRVHFPALTEESRRRLTKVVKEKLEEARVKVRGLREEANKSIDNDMKEGLFGEDEKRRLRDEVQSYVDEANGKLENMWNLKEKEIMGE